MKWFVSSRLVTIHSVTIIFFCHIYKEKLPPKLTVMVQILNSRKRFPFMVFRIFHISLLYADCILNNQIVENANSCELFCKTLKRKFKNRIIFHSTVPLCPLPTTLSHTHTHAHKSNPTFLRNLSFQWNF